ncbi:MAG: lysozyme [Alphaproteobacteria bacterium]
MSLYDLTHDIAATRRGHRLALRLRADQARYDETANSVNGFLLEDPAQLTLSDDGLAFLKAYEGEVRDARGRHVLYDNDGGGHCTIGHGHLVHKGLCNGTDASEQPFLQGLSDAQADALFRADLQDRVRQVRDYLGAARLTQPMFDALCALHFNVHTRPGWTLYRALKDRDYAQAACQMDVVTANGQLVRGLVNRRLAEIRLFLFGIGAAGEVCPGYLACRAPDALPSLSDPV